MRNHFPVFTVLAGIAFMTGCGGPTTAAEIDGIMAEARKDTDKDLTHARNEPAANAPSTVIADYSSKLNPAD